MSRGNSNIIKFERNEKDIRFSFFPAKRRKIVLEKMTANEKDNNPNLVFSFCMPLTGEPLVGIPEFVQPAYEAVNTEGSLVPSAGLGKFELVGMTVEFFRNEANRKRMICMVNKSLFDFTVEKDKDGDTFITVMRFKIRVEETKARLLFWHDLRGVTMWMEATPCADAVKEADDQQMTFEEQAAHEHAEDEEEDSEEMPRQTPERAAAVLEA